ncbi:hypothetical protein S245_066831, partial [Arachis hypogaea]
VKATIDRYKKACSDSSGAGSASKINAQYYQQKAEMIFYIYSEINAYFLGPVKSAPDLLRSGFLGCLDYLSLALCLFILLFIGLTLRI